MASLVLGAFGRPCSRSGRATRCPFRLTTQLYVRGFSTTDAQAAKEDNGKGGAKHRQSFVTHEIEPQEWDYHYTDPLSRPKYRSRAKILSRHDYARQNGVTFEDQYATFEDAMVTLSWLDSKTQKRIYENYLSWMVNAEEKFGKTSHEYVCRLLAQKFYITPFRAAAIIQLQHSEEQFKLKHPDEDIGNVAETMDLYMKNTIKEAYKSTGEVPPESFVEPLPNSGMESHKVMAVDDLMDIDQLTIAANTRDQERARMMINDHQYIEDIDDVERDIPMSKDAMNLIKMKKKLKKSVASPLKSPAVEMNRPPRWKFVAQAIDTGRLNPKSKRQKAKDGQKLWGKRHRNGFQQNWAENTLIEEGGDLRPANLAEVRNTSWKPVRHVQEFTYKGVKQAWLERKKGDKSAWGKAPVRGKADAEEGEKEEIKVEVVSEEELVGMNFVDLDLVEQGDIVSAFAPDSNDHDSFSSKREGDEDDEGVKDQTEEEEGKYPKNK